MALDKLVDSAQLDTDLTAVAGAIRTKGGTSAQLAFPAGFVDAIAAIRTGGSLKYEIGDFVLASDIRYTWIPHSLGVVPKVIVVWQSTYSADNPPDANTNLMMVWLYGIMDFPQRMSSSSQSNYGFFAYSGAGAGATNVGFTSPSSAAYGPDDTSLPTATQFPLLLQGGTAWAYRAGVQYHYFISEAWWI